MLASAICPRCTRLLTHLSISRLPRRCLATATEPIAAPLADDADAVPELDRNVSRLPDDVYRQFKGKSLAGPRSQHYVLAG